MTVRREKAKAQKPQLNKQLEAAEATEVKPIVNQRKEKLADYLIDVSKYVLTGVVITSLFNDVTDKTIIYLIGLAVVCLTLWSGIMLTNKRKDK
jgi:Mg2+/citrate symporter